jgi:predicted nucleic acid-binding protein
MNFIEIGSGGHDDEPEPDDAPTPFGLADFLIAALAIAAACGVVVWVLRACGEKVCW